MDIENDSEPCGQTAIAQPGRTRARLATVQALYQMDLTQRDLSAVLNEFISHRFDTVEIYAGADRGFFRDLASGVAHCPKIHPLACQRMQSSSTDGDSSSIQP